MRATNLREWNQERMQNADIGAWFKHDGVNYLKIDDQGKWANWETSGNMGQTVSVCAGFWSTDWADFAEEELVFFTIERAPLRKMMSRDGDGRAVMVRAPRVHKEGTLVKTTMTDVVAFLLGQKEALKQEKLATGVTEVTLVKGE